MTTNDFNKGQASARLSLARATSPQRSDGVVSSRDLATDLFGQPTSINPAYSTAPGGFACARGTRLYPLSGEFEAQRCKSRSCPDCRHIMAWRRLRGIQEESVTYWTKILYEEWGAIRKYHYRQGMPYLGFPQGDVHAIRFMVVVSNLGERDLPVSEAETVELIDTWFANIPKGKRIRPSRFGGMEFGGEYWGGARKKPTSEPSVYISRDVELIVAGAKAELRRQARALKEQGLDLCPDWRGKYRVDKNVVALILAQNKEFT